MAGILFTLAAASLAVILQVVPLIRKRWFREAAVYVFLLAVGSWFTISTINLINMPSPLIVLSIIFAPILKAIGVQ